MNRYFVFSDVHGEYFALVDALNEAGYNPSDPKHILVSLGDNFDRGPNSIDVYRLLTHNKQNICIKGNHETFLEEALEKGIDGEFVFFNILHNGLLETIQSFVSTDTKKTISTSQIQAYIDAIKERRNQLLPWLKKMPLYFETKNYFFCHAGVDPNIYPTLPDEHFILWDVECSHIPIRSSNKTFIIGHHHAFRVKERAEQAGYSTTKPKIPWVGCEDENAPVMIGNKIAIDPCSNLTHKVNVLVIDDEPLEESPKENTVKSQDEARITSNGDAVYTIHYGQNHFTYEAGVFNNPDITFGAYINPEDFR